MALLTLGTNGEPTLVKWNLYIGTPRGRGAIDNILKRAIKSSTKSESEEFSRLSLKGYEQSYKALCNIQQMCQGNNQKWISALTPLYLQMKGQMILV
jgi:hypothetical protein